MTGKEMLQEIWREIREDIKSWNIQWRWLTRAELREMHPRINPATGLPLVGGSMLDGAGNPYGTDLSWTRPIHQSSTDDSRRSFSHFNDDCSPCRNRTFSDFNGDPFDW
jgi:hypothetical protein